MDVRRDSAEVFSGDETQIAASLQGWMDVYDELDRQKKPGFMWSDIFGFSLRRRTVKNYGGNLLS
ncbi:hypothetical protein H7347_09035 [Corynebacterium sp. zg-331]|uniref:hypothetical protein n=1 Tax=unclassified Corynebacterium TaxID=2624378 RepID=UPI00128E5907|nr:MULTISPECIES: hypothetical protein [unclassified Corynebacterium]MBC3186705.1 hypothetical protein [Corynebacterium sp. zg-331]MPV53187.1 hypothetical protein [Corynebacterium sp. zg331]